MIRLTNNVLSVEVTAFGIQREPLSDNSRIVGDSEVIIHDDGDFSVLHPQEKFYDQITERSMLATFVLPVSAIATRNSCCRMLRALVTPASPAAPSP